MRNAPHQGITVTRDPPNSDVFLITATGAYPQKSIQLVVRHRNNTSKLQLRALHVTLGNSSYDICSYGGVHYMPDGPTSLPLIAYLMLYFTEQFKPYVCGEIVDKISTNLL